MVHKLSKQQIPGKSIPRIVELAVALIGLIVFAPLILVAMAAIVLTSKGPALFRQERVGLDGKVFILNKLRTMNNFATGPQVTTKGDKRVTTIGRFLRKTKLDELPQLWNVVNGSMSLVGPRPEVPKYVDLESPVWQLVLKAKPGITDPVTLRLRNEEELLLKVHGERELFYREVLQPIKLQGYLAHLATRNWRTDVKVLVDTALAVFYPARVPPPTVKELQKIQLLRG